MDFTSMMKKRAAFAMVVKLLDSNDGELIINTDAVKRVFNDEYEHVCVEHTDGTTQLAYDQSFETLDSIVKAYKQAHSKQFLDIIDNFWND